MKKMFIFALMIVGILFSAQTVMAQNHPTDGLYVGIDGSYDLLKDNIAATGDNVYDTDGPAVGIFAGYRQSNGQFTVAAEARYGYSFASRDTATTPLNGFELTHEFGAAILPGYWLNDQFLIYGRLGYNHATLVDTINDVQFSNGDSSFEFGGGIEVFPSETVSMRLEYTRTAFDGFPTLTSNGVTFNDWNIRRDRFRVALTTAF